MGQAADHAAGALVQVPGPRRSAEAAASGFTRACSRTVQGGSLAAAGRCGQARALLEAELARCTDHAARALLHLGLGGTLLYAGEQRGHQVVALDGTSVRLVDVTGAAREIGARRGLIVSGDAATGKTAGRAPVRGQAHLRLGAYPPGRSPRSRRVAGRTAATAAPA